MLKKFSKTKRIGFALMATALLLGMIIFAPHAIISSGGSNIPFASRPVNAGGASPIYRSGVAPSYTNSMLGDLPLMTVRPGQKGPEVFRPKGSCTTVTHVGGSDEYVIYSRTTDGRIVQGGGDGKATTSWIFVPRNEDAPATVQFTRHRC